MLDRPLEIDFVSIKPGDMILMKANSDEVDIDICRKIAGELQEKYPGSPVLCLPAGAVEVSVIEKSLILEELSSLMEEYVQNVDVSEYL